MAICQIWEHYAPGNSHEQVAMLPGKAPQNVTISSSSAASATLDNATIGVRLLSDTDCWFLCSTAGTAATAANGIRLLAGQSEYWGVPPAGGYKITIITA